MVSTIYIAPEIILADKLLLYIHVGVIAAYIFWRFRERLLDFIITIAVSGTVAETLKYFIAEPRPVSPIYYADSSFPSTHTTYAFTAFFFLLIVCHGLMFEKRRLGWSKQYSWSYILFLIASFLSAITVGWLRVAVGAHFPHDVIAGIIIALIIVSPFKYYDVSARRLK